MTEQADVSEDVESEGDQENPETADQGKRIDAPLSRVLAEIGNISLLRDGWDSFTETDWYAVSLTSFHLGFIGLVAWSSYMFLAFVIVSLVTSQGLLSAATRTLNFAPFASVAVFLFAIVSNRAVRGMQEVHTNDEPEPLPRLSVVIISSIALVTAAAYRAVIYTTLHEMYGPTLSRLNVVSVLIVDGLHISLLLIGLGGFASLIFAPSGD